MTTPAAATEPATSAFFRVSRTGSTGAPLIFSACLAGTAFANVDYEVRVNGNLVPADLEFTEAIPVNASYLDVEIRPLDDFEAEGPETVRIALKDVTDGTYVVGGNGFAELTINDNDQPVVTVTKPLGDSDASETEPITPRAWSIQTASPIESDLKVYFKLSGNANIEVDYYTSLVSEGVSDDNDGNDNIILPSGTCRATLHPGTGPGNIAQTLVYLTPFQDSRTEGTESATATLLTHPAYKLGSPAAASLNITDNDTPKLPANGYTIMDLGDAIKFAVGINDNALPYVAVNYIPAYGAPYRAGRVEGAYFIGIVSPSGSLTDSMLAKGMNSLGWVVGAGNSSYYWRWDGSTTIQLQVPNPSVDPDYGPRAINDANWIVGAAKNSAGVLRATRWDASGTVFNLDGLNPASEFSSFAWALGASATGHRVAGESRIEILNGTAETTAFHAFRTQPGIPPTADEPQQIVPSDDLGNSLASDTSSSGAYAINSLFEIAGYSASSATEQRAAYKDGNSGKHKGWRTLGVLQGGSGAGLSAQALGMNDVGLIVGWSRSTTGNKAVAWENYQFSTATDLRTKIPTAQQAAWSLQAATAVNSSGKIVGYGLKNGAQRAFLLTPNP